MAPQIVSCLVTVTNFVSSTTLLVFTWITCCIGAASAHLLWGGTLTNTRALHR
jgi:hypothetical protein